MTRRATFTQAELARAIRAAKAEGVVAQVIRTPDGATAIAFAPPDAVAPHLDARPAGGDGPKPKEW